ncbi:unnamed protein product, partial [Staurois parvus]
WGPRAVGDDGAPVSLPKLKKAYEKGTRGISWPWALGQCLSFQMVSPPLDTRYLQYTSYRIVALNIFVSRKNCIAIHYINAYCINEKYSFQCSE